MVNYMLIIANIVDKIGGVIVGAFFLFFAGEVERLASRVIVAYCVRG